jgi:hypothetical protein
MLKVQVYGHPIKKNIYFLEKSQEFQDLFRVSWDISEVLQTNRSYRNFLRNIYEFSGDSRIFQRLQKF